MSRAIGQRLPERLHGGVGPYRRPAIPRVELPGDGVLCFNLQTAVDICLSAPGSRRWRHSACDNRRWAAGEQHDDENSKASNCGRVMRNFLHLSAHARDPSKVQRLRDLCCLVARSLDHRESEFHRVATILAVRWPLEPPSADGWNVTSSNAFGSPLTDTFWSQGLARLVRTPVRSPEAP